MALEKGRVSSRAAQARGLVSIMRVSREGVWPVASTS